MCHSVQTASTTNVPKIVVLAPVVAFPVITVFCANRRALQSAQARSTDNNTALCNIGGSCFDGCVQGFTGKQCGKFTTSCNI
ncbi:hypothetical protein DPMN_073057 [Dreissena polymorpha]|uniref:Uncharacterized protein n=1 Tax=Dreissena polymorpha TaxID=45954 RepID=A0A9D4BYC7_DREPO|nr:hypothetical protein DPMN_073057 [Dreissena polymorpha]